MLRSSSWSVFSLPLWVGIIACATLNDSRLPNCEPIEALPALPDTACMEDGQTAEYRDRLRNAIGSDAGPVLVRAMLDESPQLRSLCVASTRTPGGARAARKLSQRLSEFSEIPGGPACLANRRLDFNRRAAKLAEIKKLRVGCHSDASTVTREAEGIVEMSSSDIVYDNIVCLNEVADWVAIQRSRLSHITIFAKPEVADPPNVDARTIRKSCFTLNGFEERVSCIEGFGWELLE
jgi:hypothetical protein